VSAEGYRFWPKAVSRRRIPQAFYNRIRAQITPVSAPAEPRNYAVGAARQAADVTRKKQTPGVEISQELYDMAGFEKNQKVGLLKVK